MNSRPRVVIVGAGFGGLQAARSLKDAPVDIVLIDRYNYHTFQPLLYQVATAALEPSEIAHTVRGIFQKQKNFQFRMGVVAGVDWPSKQVVLQDEAPVAYDTLILAFGASTNYFGIEGAEQHTFPLKTLQEAAVIRSHIIHLFEEVDADPGLIDRGWLNFVVVGGGPTGVEMAGALMELFHMVLRKDFTRVDVSRARVVLLEATDKLLGSFHESLRRNTVETLRRSGVEVRLGEAVVQVTPETVHLKSGEVIPTRTVVWGAGVRANALVNALGVELGRGGRIVVGDDLSIPDHPECFAIGDVAASRFADGSLHPQLAQVALQGAKHAAGQIRRRMSGEPGTPFVYRDPGTMATIGRNAAVAQLPNGLKMTGWLAWLAWLFLHLLYLVGYRNRLSVLVDWIWNYFTYDRGVRLILPFERRKDD